MLHLSNSPGGRDFYFPTGGDTHLEYFYDIWGNIHYGYVGHAAAFSAQELKAVTRELPKVLVGGGDDNAEQLGVDLWDKYRTGLTVADLRNNFRARALRGDFNAKRTSRIFNGF